MTSPADSRPPALLQTVLDTEDARGLAEFYRELLGLQYRAGDEPPPAVEPDPHGEDWLVLSDDTGHRRLAFQQVEHLPPPIWPEGERPQMMHLDTFVPTLADLQVQRRRALDLGARELYDRSEDADEPLFVFADPAGHPFRIFVAG